MGSLRYVALVTALAVAGPASASLLGLPITGSLVFEGDITNYFDPAYGYVPSTGYLNSDIPDPPGGSTVTIQNPDINNNPYIEFGFDDGYALYSADFTNDTLTISEVVSNSFNSVPFTMTFTLNRGVFISISENSDNFLDGGLTPSLDSTENTIAINWTDGSGLALNPGDSFTATFSIEAIPEPVILALMSVGLAGIGLGRRRRVPAASA